MVIHVTYIFNLTAFMFPFHQSTWSCVLPPPWPGLSRRRIEFPQKYACKENKWPRWETHGCKWKICTEEWLRHPETCSKSVSRRTRGWEIPSIILGRYVSLNRHLNGLGGSFKPPVDTPPTPIAQFIHTTTGAILFPSEKPLTLAAKYSRDIQL